MKNMLENFRVIPALKKRVYTMGSMLIFLGIFSNSQCHQLKHKIDFPYNMHHPDREYVLEQKLTEVSGLSFTSSTEVALIQDESGSIFFYDMQSERVTRKINFSKRGDYEDLVMMGDTAYVLRSDGDLYRVSGLNSDHVEELKIQTPLSGKNNTEGLCYDKQKNLFLIACKGKPTLNKKGKDFENQKAVYAFNPASGLLSDTPYVLIDVNEVQKLSRGTYSNFLEKLIHFYTKAGAVHTFEPSAIAINPATRELYVLSSVGKVLVILTPEGKMSSVIKLDPSIFRQPEGIAFDSANNLYITNEGKNHKGNILKFDLHPSPLKKLDS